jgi:hypothetical protein
MTAILIITGVIVFAFITGKIIHRIAPNDDCMTNEYYNSNMDAVDEDIFS